MIENLLYQISAITKKHELINKKTGGCFNIFDIADISADEVVICKVLYEFLNPNGSHYQGDAYLRRFVGEVLKLDFTEQDYKSARVFREYVVSGGRRIDLYIETDNYKIPIEVKIYAGDQYRQCYDYYTCASKSDVFYLTLTGSIPSAESADGLTPIYDDNELIGYEGVTQISFKYNIMSWLITCLTHTDTIKIAPIREIILQLNDVLGRLTGQLEGDTKMEIVNTILSSTENVKNALDIAKALPEVKARIMINLFSELKRLFEKSGRKTFDYDDEDIEYYVSCNKLYICLSVEIAKLPDDLMATIGIEIPHNDSLNFFFAFTQIDDGGESCSFIESADVETDSPKVYASFAKAVDEVMGRQGYKTKYSIFWEYLFDDKGRKYDFKNFSPSCADLTENYAEQAKRIFEMLDGYIDSVSEKFKVDI